MARAYARSVSTERMAAGKRLLRELREKRGRSWLRIGAGALIAVITLGTVAAALMRW